MLKKRKIFLQNSAKIMKIGYEIRKLWHFEISCFFRKHFLTSPYEYPHERVDDVIPSQFSIDFIYRYDKNLIFPLWKYKTCLITTHNNWDIMLTLIYFDMGIWFYQYELKSKIFEIHIQYIWKIVRAWHHQLAHLNIQKDWSRNVFRKIWNFKMSQLPYFLSDFHHLWTNL